MIQLQLIDIMPPFDLICQFSATQFFNLSIFRETSVSMMHAIIQLFLDGFTIKILGSLPSTLFILSTF